MSKQWTSTVTYDIETDELLIPLPDDLLEAVNWYTGDDLEWIDNIDGSFTVKKIENKVWVLVECIHQARMRYVIEAPADHPEYALDDVVCQTAKEFSQQDLGETIVSHRVVSGAEALAICDEDNAYLKDWPDHKKIDVLFTREGESWDK